MITLKQVSYIYPEQTQPVLQNLNLSIAAGAFVLLAGPSGAGKSTLLRCLNGLVPHFSGGTLSGSLHVNGLNPVQATPQLMSHHVGFVFQDPETQFVMDRVEDELAFALENAAYPLPEMRRRVESVLNLLDLTALRDRTLDTLSGGERQRVAIASVLTLQPQILVLDEPTSQLDPQAAAEVLQLVVRLNQMLGLTVVLAEHRLERVLPFVDTIIYLDQETGTLWQGPPRDILAKMPLVPPLIEVGQKLGWQPLPLTLESGRQFSQTWLKQSRKQAQTYHNRKSSLVHASEPPLLQMHGVQVSYGQDSVLNQVDLSIWAGEVTVLMGQNGAGKTTLLKCLVGLIRPDQGHIRFANQDISHWRVAKICRSVGYLPQDPNSLLFADTVLDECLITLRNHGLYPVSEREDEPIMATIQSLLGQLGLGEKAKAYPRDLSTGERQRVALGAITVTQPAALVLDEPTRGLDYAAKRHLARLLQTWRTEGKAILLVTHDVEFAALIADRILLLKQGTLIADGTPERILGTSPLFAPQVAQLFPETGWLTVADVASK